MAKYLKKKPVNHKKDIIFSETRKKLGVTQSQLATIFGVSRAYLTMAESKRRNLGAETNLLLTEMYLQFHELETGQQADDRSLETRLFLNAVYRQRIPEMKTRENDRRRQLKLLQAEMQAMKELARNTENAIIVFTTTIRNLEENEPSTPKAERLI